MTILSANIAAFVSGLAGALALTPAVVAVARGAGIIDLPGVRKVHATPVARAGGLAIALATLLPMAVLLWWLGPVMGIAAPRGQVLTVMAAGSLVLLVGLLDDLIDLSSKYKLLALMVAAMAVCAGAGSIDTIWIGTFGPYETGVFAWPLTILWICGVTVSLNFIDGLDGLAAGLAAAACGVLAVAAGMGGAVWPCLLALTLLGSLCGFLFFNFHPAKVFMGDCGSMFVGFTFASCCVLASGKVGATKGLMLPALALAVPLIDTLLTMVRRSVLHRRSVFSAERGHVHHRLLDLGLRQHHAVLILYAVTLAASGVAVMAILGMKVLAVAGMLLLTPLLVGLFRISGSVRARETLRAIRRNRAIAKESKQYRSAYDELQLRFRTVTTFEAWWRELCNAAELFGFTRMTLPLANRDGSSWVLKWSSADVAYDPDSLVKASLPVEHRRPGESLRAEVEVPTGRFLEVAGQRVALFARLVAEHSLKSLAEEKAPMSQTPFGTPDAALPPPHISPLPAGVRVAVVHDFLYTYAGAERVLEQIIEVVPEADLFSIFDFLPEDQRQFIKNKPVNSTFIQRMPFARKKHRAYLPLMPLAIEQLDVSNYDVVISSSYLAAKGVITRANQLHICYCHSPVRFAWDLQHQYLGEAGLTRGIKSVLARMVLHYVRTWDTRTSNGVDRFLSNSDYVGRRIEKVYRRESKTLYPPVEVAKFALHEEKQDFYLTASRMVPYKRIDLVVDAFSRMPDKQLIVIGEGPDFEKIKAKAGANVRLLGHQPFHRLLHYMQRAKGFVFAAEEDFGIVPVEAMACGTPVIAFGRGGATESVIDGVTGVFFHHQTEAAIIDAVKAFESRTFVPATIRTHAERFSVAHFRAHLSDILVQEWADFTTVTTRGGRDIADPARVPRIDPYDGTLQPTARGDQ